MQDRVQLLNVAVDIAATKVASDTTIEYLKNESSQSVYFLNSESLLLLEKDGDSKEAVEQCDLVLPGTSSVNKSINDILGYRRDAFFLESYLDSLLEYAIETGCEILIVAESEERFVSIQESLREKHQFLAVSGVYLTEQEESSEHIVNEINSVAPEILLVALEEDKQLFLLRERKHQINARLMLFTGNILYNKAVSEAEVPTSVQKFGIDHLYKWYRKSGRFKAFITNIRMKLKLKQKKNDKGL